MKNSLFATALLLAAGTVSAQIEVSTLANLDNIRNDLGGDYILVNDIDASATADPEYNGGEGWLPIGREGGTMFPFTGTFDGQDFTITGLTMNRPADAPENSGLRAGLFGELRNEAAISNLHLMDVDIQGNTLVGGLAGYMEGTSKVTNCSVSGKVRGESRVGGLVGYHLAGVIENSWSEGEIESPSGSIQAGGLVGITESLIRNSYSTCTVSGGSWVGGLVGRVDSDGTVEECFATGDVTAATSLVGGLTGAQGGLIVRSYATGNAFGEPDSANAGGLVGRQETGADLQDSFARGDATGTTMVAGLLGHQRGGGILSRCFSTGSSTGSTHAGGLIGWQQESFATDAYWDTESSGRATSAGGEGVIGLTTTQMTTPFEGGAYSGWDFDDVWIEEDEANDGYPIHRWQTVRHTLQYTAGANGSVEGNLEQVRIPGLSGTAVTALPDPGFEFLWWSDGSTENPRQDLKVTSDVDVVAYFVDPALSVVSTLADLDNIRNDLGGDYVLVNDIDASATADPEYNGGEGWLPIGRVPNAATSFTGTFDGQDFTITGLTFNRPEGTITGSGFRAGLFADLNDEAVVSNLHLREVNFLGNDRVGGIAGSMRGDSTVINCSVSGKVSGVFRVGGLVGSHAGMVIEDSWSEGEVEISGESNQQAGGLAGQSESLIQNSYSTSDVSGRSWVGGLVGRIEGGTVEECFAAGDATGTGSLIGGLAGASSGAIVRSYATGTVHNPPDGFGGVGGLVGRQDDGSDVQDSFARGDAVGAPWGGGLVGQLRAESSVNRSYSTGSPSPTGSSIGGLLGSVGAASVVTASYWDTVSSGQSTSAGGEGAIGLTTEQMTTPFEGGAYTGWDFDDVWIEEGEANDGYPIHRWQTVRHTLQYTAGANGSVEGDLEQVRIPGLSGTTVTALPDPGFEFLQWSDGSTENPRRDLRVTSDVDVVAEFVGPDGLQGAVWMLH